MSGVDFDGTRLRKGAADAVIGFVEQKAGECRPSFRASLDRIAREGGTPLAVARDARSWASSTSRTPSRRA